MTRANGELSAKTRERRTKAYLCIENSPDTRGVLTWIVGAGKPRELTDRVYALPDENGNFTIYRLNIAARGFDFLFYPNSLVSIIEENVNPDSVNSKIINHAVQTATIHAYRGPELPTLEIKKAIKFPQAPLHP